jgi:uncharacterized protein YoxC
MCQGCGCDRYVGRGKQVALDRAVEIVKELGLTVQNLDDYENTELICDFIAPFGSQEDEVFQTAVWEAALHLSMPRLNRQERYKAHVRAFQDIFSRLPARGDPKHIVTVYHQLEQMVHELDEKDLASLDAETRDALQAVKRVHADLAAKAARLKEKYGL